MKYTAELEKAINQREQTAALCIELQILHLYEECIGFDSIDPSLYGHEILDSLSER
ncbi:hypothetical protein BC30090_0969 [Bacillus cereus]|uniref:hypothetical protein n=1 Tax=Bacillus paranthracis TaxID=2026186 RepID=UPI0013D10B02|nr:hypothetical protein [Bacillus paranthracis]MCU5299853.1 hypothetical protein [Bacillus paranthracis]MDU3870126.1 hypothetical protein [Bacillus paranthracis]BCD22072.1 hypothetical protein BC30090_0969 [Bacillus cereus]